MANPRVTSLPPYLVVVVVVLVGLAGCGVSVNDSPIDVGDAAVVDDRQPDNAMRQPPTAPDASTADGLVRDFLMTAAGGLAPAHDRVRGYLTGDALASWQAPVNPDSPSVTVIRIVGGPTTQAAIGRRTPVSVTYQTVGTLTDQGRVDELVAPTTREMTFWVVPDDLTRPRIDEIQGWPGGLVVSDTTLTEYYRVQPIYFWDTGFGLLVPDVRYLPLTLNPDQRAAQVLRWLEAGPSPWLGGAIQRLPSTISVEGAVARDDRGRLQVPLAPEAPIGDADALRRFIVQLQWSLWDGSSNAPLVDLSIDGTEIPINVSPDEFREFNRSWSAFQEPRDAYNITVDGRIEAVAGTQAPPVLAVGENAGVRYAAIRADEGVAALVRIDQFGRDYLQIARVGQPAITPGLQPRVAMGRPSFVPGTDTVLVPTGGADGRLMAVSIVDGSVTDVTGTLPGVTSVAVSPDGRRVAFIADEQAYVSSLIVANGTVTVGSTPRQILAGQLAATAIAWTSESWLMVGGTAGGIPALWHVTSDGVVARNNSTNMGGLDVLDLVWIPLWTSISDTIEVLAVTSSGVYRFRRGFAQEPTLTNPFYGE